MRITTAAGFFTLIVPSLCYDVQFYTGIQCRGERLGGAVGLTPDDGCQDGSLYSINANSVYIAQGDTEEDLQIAFYEGDNCPLENAVATGNVGACLSVGGAYQQFDSYNAFPIIPRSKREDSVQAHVNDDPSDFQHGALFEDDDGVQWRLQQIAENAFRGIRAEEWSSTMRVANTQPLPNFDDKHTVKVAEDPNESPAESAKVSAVASKRSPNPAHEVELALMPLENLQPYCTAIASCFIAIGGLPEQYFPRSTQYVIAQIERAWRASTLENLWTFLNSPFFLATGGAYIATRYIPASPDTPDAPAAQCTQGQNLALDTAEQCINWVAASSGRGETNNIQCTFVDESTGERGALSLSYLPNNIDPQCGAPRPPRRLSTGVISRAERALLGDVPAPLAY